MSDLNWRAILVRALVTFVQVALPLIYVNGQVNMDAWQNALLAGGAAALSVVYNIVRQKLDASPSAPNIEGAPQDASAMK